MSQLTGDSDGLIWWIDHEPPKDEARTDCVGFCVDSVRPFYVCLCFSGQLLRPAFTAI